MPEQNNSQNQRENQETDTSQQLIVGKGGSVFHLHPVVSLIFIALTEIGIILWQLYEKLLPKFPFIANVGLLISILCFGGYGVYNVVKSDEFQKNYPQHSKKVWAAYAVWCIALASVFILMRQQETQPIVANIQPVVVMQQPVYIDGTDVPKNQLDNFFPFGYAVVYYSGTERTIQEYFKTGKVEWTINWNSVKVEPNLSNQTVEITMEPISANGTNVSATFTNGARIGTVIPLKRGSYWRMGPFLAGGPDNPAPYAVVLNDNQRSPVIAIGFRIPSPETP